jgi:hypothetical protein
MQRKTESHRWAWIAHHRLQWGPNWKYVAKRYLESTN